jgi:hypothetical protein
MCCSSRNIFNIENPQTYFCTVWSYLVNHSMLLVRIDKGELDNGIFYLCFELVQYFEGPLRWKGADFCVGASDECIELLHKTGSRGISEDYLLDQFSLFVVELPNFEMVKILAARRANKTQNIPPLFSLAD